MTEPTPPSWERATLERIALRALDEQRRARQWTTLIRLLWLTLFFLIVAAALGWIGSPGKEPLRTGKHTALVDLKGVIGVESRASADKMIAALEGWSFTGPKGQQTIRASDHAMLQPMFQVKLTEKNGKYVPVVLKSLRAKYTAPPEKK